MDSSWTRRGHTIARNDRIPIEATRELQAESANLLALDRFPVECLVTGFDRQILFASRSFCDARGFGREDLLQSDLFRLFTKASQILYDSYLIPLLLRERRCDDIRLNLVNHDGSRSPVTVNLQAGAPNRHLIYWSVATASRTNQMFDELAQAQTLLKGRVSQLHTLSETDQLTGVPNRLAFTRTLEDIIAASSDQRLAVGFLDLDGFKTVNDTYGHATGDELLRLAAQRMAGSLRQGDLISRFGGDEFVVLLRDVSAPTVAEALFRRLAAQLNAPFRIESNTFRLTASIGITLHPQPEPTAPEHLIRQADQAMYKAKLSGKDRVCHFNTHAEKGERERFKALTSVRTAIAYGEFLLVFQPRVNLLNGQILGAEALIRWQQAGARWMTPEQFLPVLGGTAEERELGNWVLHNALSQLMAWQSAGIDWCLSINIGGGHLQHPEFLRDLQQALTDYPGVRPQKLEIEILETSALSDTRQVAGVLRACRELGVRVSLDDFGTGYSSLSHLNDLTVDGLKIDRTFIDQMLSNPGALAIVKGVISFASAFDYEVIAEGIETLSQATRLTDLGCTLGQGFYIARPMPGVELLAWSRQWRDGQAHETLPRTVTHTSRV